MEMKEICNLPMQALFKVVSKLYAS